MKKFGEQNENGEDDEGHPLLIITPLSSSPYRTQFASLAYFLFALHLSGY